MSQLLITNLCKKYGDNVVVSDLNLEVHSGEMVSLLGPSGCGKTTTLRMVAGLHEPTSGSIKLDGKELTVIPPHKRNVGLVFQNYALFPHLNVFENVAFGLKRRGVPKREIKQRVEEVLHSVRLDGMETRMPSELSGGQQQRVALARTLVLKPPLVLFDEPLSNLDAKLRTLLRVEIRKLQQEFGFTGIFVTHDQEEAMVLSDRIAVMNKGKIAQIGTPREVYTTPADEFVADFVGESNMLQVESAEDAGSHWRIRLAGGYMIKAPKREGVSRPKLVMIRPEAAELAAGQPDDDHETNSLEGAISFIQYNGSSYAVDVDIKGMTKPFKIKIQDAQNELGLRMGDKAKVRWAFRTTFIL
jgi:spermidine/putrescine ABC transporter ATP-binding subunit